MLRMPERLTILLIGLGGLGGAILELLAREPWAGRIVGADLDLQRGNRRVNLARLSAVSLGAVPDIEFQALDLTDRDGIVRAVRAVRPDVIVSTASLQSWWLIDLLPEPQAARLRRARFGAWLPVHFVLTRKLMEGLAAAGFRGFVLTAPFPDVVNAVLGRLGLAPTAGLGNVDEIIPKIEHLAAGRLGVGPGAVRAFLVGHHALEAAAFGDRDAPVPPHFLRVEHDGIDVTTRVDGEALLRAPYPLPAGPAWHALTAASTIRLLRGLVSAEPVLRHVPAPGGLPGGYPVWASRQGLAVAEIPGLSLPEAIALNEASHRFDGIERIERDGTVVFDTDSVDALDGTLGYRCPRLPPDEADARALELVTRFRDHARQHGVDIDRLVRILS
jgi:hypothetical protein